MIGEPRDPLPPRTAAPRPTLGEYYAQLEANQPSPAEVEAMRAELAAKSGEGAPLSVEAQLGLRLEARVEERDSDNAPCAIRYQLGDLRVEVRRDWGTPPVWIAKIVASNRMAPLVPSASCGTPDDAVREVVMRARTRVAGWVSELFADGAAPQARPERYGDDYDRAVENAKADDLERERAANDPCIAPAIGGEPPLKAEGEAALILDDTGWRSQGEIGQCLEAYARTIILDQRLTRTQLAVLAREAAQASCCAQQGITGQRLTSLPGGRVQLELSTQIDSGD